MSVVVAIKENGKIYIGADSQVTKGGTRTTLKNENNYKVWRVIGAPHCLMAHVGNLRDANVVRLMDDLVTDYNIYRKHIGFDFVVKKVVPEIVEQLSQFGYLKEGKNADYIDSSFLFAYKDQLWVISQDKSVIEVEDYVAIGSGADQAIGSLLSTEGQSPKERIVKAIKSSAATDIYVDYPIILVDTEYGKFEIVTEKTEGKYIGDKSKRVKDEDCDDEED